MTDWLRHRLVVSGPPARVEQFRAAARGTNAVPWPLDPEHEAARLLALLPGGGPAARALVRDLRDAVAARHDRVLARWAEPGTCPLDLHRLIPVPENILRLGADHPEARRWLWAHWGTTQPLRQVRIIEAHADRRRRRGAVVALEFWSADWTPWQAIRRLRRDFSPLILAVEPRYDDG